MKQNKMKQNNNSKEKAIHKQKRKDKFLLKNAKIIFQPLR